MPDGTHVNVMIHPFDVAAVVRTEPDFCVELWWGKKLAGVRVSLPDAPSSMVETLLRAAWKRKAPKRLST